MIYFYRPLTRQKGWEQEQGKCADFFAKFIVSKKYISFCLEHWTLQNKDYTSNKKVQGDEFMVTFEL